jgi:aminopeptidase N
VRPVFGDDGAWYFRVPGSLLQAGENTLELRYPATALQSAPEVEVFSLADPYEEDHFRQTFAPASIRVQPPADPAQNLYDVLHYDLEIPLNMAATVLDATLTMTAKSLSDTLQIVPLDFNDNGGTLNASRVDQGPSTSTLSFTQNSTAKRLFITLPAAVPEGNEFTVRVRYGGVPAPSKIFSPAYVRETHGSPAVPVIYTFSEPYGARDWWPCKTSPRTRPRWTCTSPAPRPIPRCPMGLLDSVVTHANGTHTYHWRETHPMATYLASICCTNYQAVRGTYTALDGETTMEVAHYLYPENFADESPALAATIDVMEFFAETYGEYPFLNEKYVTASHNDSSGMEHQTCTSLPGRDLVATVNYPPGYGRRNVHELSHMWFGDLITMRHFDHLWLNEGFATYSEALFTNTSRARPPITAT